MSSNNEKDLTYWVIGICTIIGLIAGVLFVKYILHAN